MDQNELLGIIDEETNGDFEDEFGLGSNTNNSNKEPENSPLKEPKREEKTQEEIPTKTSSAKLSPNYQDEKTQGSCEIALDSTNISSDTRVEDKLSSNNEYHHVENEINHSLEEDGLEINTYEDELQDNEDDDEFYKHKSSTSSNKAVSKESESKSETSVANESKTARSGDEKASRTSHDSSSKTKEKRSSNSKNEKRTQDGGGEEEADEEDDEDMPRGRSNHWSERGSPKGSSFEPSSSSSKDDKRYGTNNSSSYNRNKSSQSKSSSYTQPQQQNRNTQRYNPTSKPQSNDQVYNNNNKYPNSKRAQPVANNNNNSSSINNNSNGLLPFPFPVQHNPLMANPPPHQYMNTNPKGMYQHNQPAFQPNQPMMSIHNGPPNTAPFMNNTASNSSSSLNPLVASFQPQTQTQFYNHQPPPQSQQQYQAMPSSFNSFNNGLIKTPSFNESNLNDHNAYAPKLNQFNHSLPALLNPVMQSQFNNHDLNSNAMNTSNASLNNQFQQHMPPIHGVQAAQQAALLPRPHVPPMNQHMQMPIQPLLYPNQMSNSGLNNSNGLLPFPTPNLSTAQQMPAYMQQQQPAPSQTSMPSMSEDLNKSNMSMPSSIYINPSFVAKQKQSFDSSALQNSNFDLLRQNVFRDIHADNKLPGSEEMLKNYKKSSNHENHEPAAPQPAASKPSLAFQPVQKSNRSRIDLDLLLDKKLNELTSEDEKKKEASSSTRSGDSKSQEKTATKRKSSENVSKSDLLKKDSRIVDSPNRAANPPPSKISKKVASEPTSSSTASSSSSTKIASSNSGVIVIDDPEYAKKLEEQKRKREELLRMKEEKRNQRVLEMKKNENINTSNTKNQQSDDSNSNKQPVRTVIKASESPEPQKVNRIITTVPQNNSQSSSSRVIVEKLSLSTTDKSLISMCNSINLKDKVKKKTFLIH